MCYKGIFKRVFPFLLTFAAGLFIASFFVTISAPSVSFRGNCGAYRFGEIQRLRMENRELREASYRQRREIEDLRRQATTWDHADFQQAVPPVDLESPPPPPLRTPRVR